MKANRWWSSQSVRVFGSQQAMIFKKSLPWQKKAENITGDKSIAKSRGKQASSYLVQLACTRCEPCIITTRWVHNSVSMEMNFLWTAQALFKRALSRIPRDRTAGSRGRMTEKTMNSVSRGGGRETGYLPPCNTKPSGMGLSVVQHLGFSSLLC